MGIRARNIPDIVKDLHGSPHEKDTYANQRAAGRLHMRPSRTKDATKPRSLGAMEDGRTLVDAHRLARQAITAYSAVNNAAPVGKGLEGFLTIVFSYVEGAKNKTSFLKSHTPLMAKTDLATVWETLPAAVQTHYGAVGAGGHLVFEELVKSAPGYDDNRMQRPVFDIPALGGRSTIAENNKSANKRQWWEKLTLRKWLRGIVIDRNRTPTQAVQDFFYGTPIGVDQLSDANFPGKPADQEVEGYAALGGRMDRTAGGTALPVFELRSANRQISFAEARKWSLDMFDYITSLNANPTGGHTRMT
jgi:hypothetical protein